MTESPVKRKRGFACLSSEERKRVASMGGRSVPAHKRAYAVDNALARSAGLKGGMAPHASRGGGNAQETWAGAKLAQLMRLARAGKSLVEAREIVGSLISIPEFRAKCKRQGITFIRTRPKK